jgi:hypothetical protein
LVVHSSILVLLAGLGHRGRPQENPDIDPIHARDDGGAHRVTRGLQYMRLWVLSGTYPTKRCSALPRTWRRGLSPCRRARGPAHQGRFPARPPLLIRLLLRRPLLPQPPCQALPCPPCCRLRLHPHLPRPPPGRRGLPAPPPGAPRRRPGTARLSAPRPRSAALPGCRHHHLATDKPHQRLLLARPRPPPNGPGGRPAAGGPWSPVRPGPASTAPGAAASWPAQRRRWPT